MPGPEERQRIKDRVFAYFRLSGVIGSIDCSHVEVHPPKPKQAEYVNR